MLLCKQEPKRRTLWFAIYEVFFLKRSPNKANGNILVYEKVTYLHSTFYGNGTRSGLAERKL